jgi:hypothetical protein
MIKSILKLSCLVVGLIFLSTANAETCKAEFSKQQFNHVNIWKTRDHTAYCYYRANCINNNNCPPDAVYFLSGYEPKDGPWVSNSEMSSCSGSAEDCRFKKVGI